MKARKTEKGIGSRDWTSSGGRKHRLAMYKDQETRPIFQGGGGAVRNRNRFFHTTWLHQNSKRECVKPSRV